MEIIPAWGAKKVQLLFLAKSYGLQLKLKGLLGLNNVSIIAQTVQGSISAVLSSYTLQSIFRYLWLFSQEIQY